MSKKKKTLIYILAIVVALVLLAVAAVVIFSNLYIETDRQVDLKVGDSYQLPTDSGWIAPDSIQWTSHDETIVTAQNGVLTAVTCGQAEVTAKWGFVTATCKVLVHNEQYFQLEPSKLTLDKNNDITLALQKAGVSDEVVWSSSNEAVATVSNGKVIAVAAGEAVITAKAGRFTDTCVVTVVDNGLVPSFVPYGAGFEVRRTETVDVSPAIVFAGDRKDMSDAKLVYTVADESIATIDANGIATGHTIGTTTFTVSGSFRGMELMPITASLEVKPNILIALSSLDLTLQAFAYDESSVISQQLTSAVYIENVLQEDAVISWSTVDELVATVEDGLITAVGVGVTDIIATYITDDGDEIVAKVLVTVVRPEITHEDMIQMDLSNIYSSNPFTNEYVALGTFIGVYDITDEERVEVKASRDGETVYIANYSVKASGYRKYAVETSQAVIYFDALVITKVIYSYEGLMSIATTSETLDGYYVLGADIVAPDDAKLLELVPLKKGVVYTEENGFIGTFDGKGHSISNLKVYQGGLFNRIGAATIKNVAFINVQNEHKTNGAALAWECKGAIIDNVAVTSENCVKVFDYFGLGASYTNSVTVMPNGKALIESYGSYSDMKHTVCNLFAMMGKADASTKWGTRVPGIFYNYYVTDNPAALYNLHSYTTKDAMIFDVITQGHFSAFVSSFSGRSGGIYFGNTLLCQYDMEVEAPKYAVRGQETKIKADNAYFTLKTPVDGVKINYYSGILTVDKDVPEDTQIVVVVSNRSLYGVKVERTILVSNDYEKVDLTGTMYDFDLSLGDTIQITIDGLEGEAKRISLLDDTRYSEGVSISGNTLTVTRELLETLGYGTGEMCIFTTDDKVYHIDATIATRVLRTADDFKAIQSSNGVLTGYYVLGNDVDMKGELFSLVNGGTLHPTDSGFRGTLDGRGYAVKNAKVYDTGFIKWIGMGGAVKNIAFLDVQTAYTSASAIASFVSGAQIENVVVTSDSCTAVFNEIGSGTQITNMLVVMPNGQYVINGAAIFWGTGAQCPMTNINAVMGKATGAGDGLYNKMYEPSTVTQCAAYTNQNELIVSGKFEPGRIDGAAIYYGDELVAQYMLPVECPQYVIRGKSVKIQAQNATFHLKNSISGVSINSDGVLTVAASVPEDTQIAVIVKDKMLPIVQVEKTVIVTNDYKKVDLTGTMYDFDLSDGDSISITVTGLSGELKKLSVLDGFRYSEGVTLNGNVLTVEKTLLEQLGTGVQELCIYTSDDKVYHIDATIADRVITQASDFEAIRSSNGVLTGYYVLGSDVDMKGQLFSLINGGTLDPLESGFRGTLDGRGYAVKNAKVYDTGFIKWIGMGGMVKNIAFLDVQTTYTNAAVIGSFVSGAKLENVVVTSDACTTVINETGSGTQITNMLAVMPNGQYIVNGAAIFWGTGAQCPMDNVHAVMGKAAGDGNGLYNKLHVTSEVTNCAVFADENGLLKSGQFAPCKLDGKGLYYGDELIAQYVLTVECPQYVIRGKSVKVQAQNATFQLKNSISGVSIGSDGVLTVAESVPEDTQIVVVVTDKTMSIVKVEVAVTVTNDYQKVDLTGRMYDFDLSDGDSISITVDGISGTLRKLSVLDGTRYSEGASLSNGVLTVEKALLEQLGTGVHELCIYTSEDEVCHIDATIADRVITQASDFEAIRSSNGLLTGYYVLGSDVDMKGQLFSLINGGTLDPLESGFRGTLDGRGYAVKNAKVYDTGFIKWIGMGGVVKNIAFMDVQTTHANAAVIGSFVSGAKLENVLVTSDACTKVITEIGSGTQITNMTAILTKGTFLVENAGIYWGTGANCPMTNIYAVMGAAGGQGEGLYNNKYVSTWENCLVYGTVNEMIDSGNYAPCTMDGGVLYYGSNEAGRYTMEVTCPTKVEIGNTAQIQVQNGGNAAFALKEPVEGITVDRSGVITVAEDVQDGITFTVVVKHEAYEKILAEYEVVTFIQYNQVDLTDKGMFDLDLSKGSANTIEADGLTGTIKGISVDEGNMVSVTGQNMSLNGQSLTVSNDVLKGFGLGEHELYVYTEEKNAYKLEVTVATKVIGNYADLKAIKSFATANGTVVDGYFVLSADITATDDTPLELAGWTAAHNPDLGFIGTLDGRGHSIIGINTGNGLFFRLGAGTVKNLGLINITGSRALGTACFGSTIENVVISGSGCTVVADEFGYGATVNNCLVILENGQRFTHTGGVYAGAQVKFSNIYTVMGAAAGATPGLHNGAHNSVWTSCKNYANVNALIQAGTIAPCTLDGGVIKYGDAEVASYKMTVTYPPQVEVGTATAQITVENGGTPSFSLKEAVAGVSVDQNGVITVADTVDENVAFTVVVQHGSYSNVYEECTFMTKLTYTQVDLTEAGMFDFDLSASSNSVAVPGLSGTLKGISVDAGNMISLAGENMSLTGNVLTISKDVLNTLGAGVHDLYVYTAEKNVYQLRVTVATKIIATYADLKAIKSFATDGGTVLDGYYVLSADITATDTAPFELAGWTAAHSPEKGFIGTLDGRGHSIIGMNVGNGLFFRLGAGTVKNLGLINITGSRALGTACFGSTIENVVITGSGCTVVADEFGYGATVNNCLVILKDGSYFTNIGGVNAGAQVKYSNVYTVMGNASGASAGLYNGAYNSVWTSCKNYANVNALIQAGTIAPCKLDGGVIKYGDTQIAAYEMTVSAPAQVGIGTDTAQVTVVNGGTPVFSLKEAVEGISIDQSGVITVENTVDENVAFTVVVQHGSYSNIRKECEIMTKQIYTQVDLTESGIYDFDLSAGENLSITVEGLTGALTGISVDEGNIVSLAGDNMSLAGDTLTVSNAVLKGFGLGEHTLYVYTAENLAYKLQAAVVTKVIGSYSDLQAINSDKTGYYVMSADVDAASNFVEIKNFAGTLDGRGYAIKNLKVYQGGLFHNVSGTTVKNLALLNVVNAHTTEGAVLSWVASGITVENLVVTSSNCIMIAREFNTGSTVTNCVAIMTNGQYFTNVGGAYATATVKYSNIYTVMGKASGDQPGLSNGKHNSTWTDCANYANTDALIASGNVAPCSSIAGALYYGRTRLATSNYNMVMSQDAVIDAAGMIGMPILTSVDSAPAITVANGNVTLVDDKLTITTEVLQQFGAGPHVLYLKTDENIVYAFIVTILDQ